MSTSIQQYVEHLEKQLNIAKDLASKFPELKTSHEHLAGNLKSCTWSSSNLSKYSSQVKVELRTDDICSFKLYIEHGEIKIYDSLSNDSVKARLLTPIRKSIAQHTGFQFKWNPKIERIIIEECGYSEVVLNRIYNQFVLRYTTDKGYQNKLKFIYKEDLPAAIKSKLLFA